MGNPSAPTAVLTTGDAMPSASKILSRVPPPMRSGTTQTSASANQGRTSSTVPVTMAPAAAAASWMRWRSFMKRSSFIWAGYSPRTINGPRSSSMREPAALPTSTSSATAGSSPARRARWSASAAATLCSATSRFATSLSTMACPAAPM